MSLYKQYVQYQNQKHVYLILSHAHDHRINNVTGISTVEWYRCFSFPSYSLLYNFFLTLYAKVTQADLIFFFTFIIYVFLHSPYFLFPHILFHCCHIHLSFLFSSSNSLTDYPSNKLTACLLVNENCSTLPLTKPAIIHDPEKVLSFPTTYLLKSHLNIPYPYRPCK